jgi:hypothetical protein
VERLETTVKEMRADTDAALTLAKQAADNSSEILAIMKGAKTASVYLQKYGWRIATGVFGYAVAAGWINKGMADAARTIFGL